MNPASALPVAAVPATQGGCSLSAHTEALAGRGVLRSFRRGLLLIQEGDLGSTLYLQALEGAEPPVADRLMREAITALVQWQSHVDASGLPAYDDALLRRELQLFPDWCVQREFNISWSDAQHATWQQLCDLLVQSALAQPKVAVHRDWMPRNLMVCAPNPGILDFQDAVLGPVTYDLVSLLKDCYVVWPRAQLAAWLDRYRDAAAAAGIRVGESREEFVAWFDCMGLQRHIKVLGIFARLWHRDGKPGYLGDLPRVLDYTLAVTGALPELARFDAYLRRSVVPAFAAVHRRASHAR